MRKPTRNRNLNHLLTTPRVYSAYEHSLLPSASIPPKPSAILPSILDPKLNLPTDIALETVFSILILCIGVVLSSQELKPIRWNVWAGRLESQKEARRYRAVGVGGGNPYAALEERAGFWDVRGARKGFEKMMKDSAGS